MRYLGSKALAAANAMATAITSFPSNALFATARRATTLQVIDNAPWYSGDYGTLNSWNPAF